MSVSTNEEFIESVFYKALQFVESDFQQDAVANQIIEQACDLYPKETEYLKEIKRNTSGGTNEEFVERIFYKALQFAEDALEQKTLSIQTTNALWDCFLNSYFQQDAVANQIMELACAKETEYLREQRNGFTA